MPGWLDLRLEMKEYYFLASLLPPLEIGHIPALGFADLMVLLDANLGRKDRQTVRKFLSMIDFQNMRAFWAKESFEKRGNLNHEQMEEVLSHLEWPSGESLPQFLIDYLGKYPSDKERLDHFSLLMSQFYAYQLEHESGFIRDFFAFQRDLHLVLVGFRAKKLSKNVAVELQYEDETDPIVAQILAQKDAKNFEPPFEYKELKRIFEEYADSPLELHKAISEYQFDYIIEHWGNEAFSLERILNYLARLILVEQWLELDVQKGIQLVDRIEKGIS